jgi:hypothetical protein
MAQQYKVMNSQMAMSNHRAEAPGARAGTFRTGLPSNDP